MARPKLDNPRRPVTVKLPPALIVRWEREAKRTGETKTALLERALTAELGGANANATLLRQWIEDPEIVARFWTKVDRRGEGECWEWLAGKRKGYGRFTPRYQHPVPAHRFAYELLVGPIPAGLVADHTCRNKACVNPEHIDIVTNRENVLRGEGVTAQLARQTHCKRGHELSGDNLIIQTNGARQCRECRRMRRREAEAAAKKAADVSPRALGEARAAAFRRVTSAKP